MTDSLQDILSNKSFNEPPEVSIVKKFVQDNFKANCQVKISPKHIVIIVSSASLAGALRLQLHELQALCGNEKRLSIRIN